MYESNLIIYDYINGEISFFLSRRSLTAKMYPNYYSFYGVDIEEETKEKALVREIQEELGIIIEEYNYLGEFETPNVNKFIFYKQIDRNIVDSLSINGGQYGKWMTLYEIIKEDMIIKEDKDIIKLLSKHISKQLYK